MALNDQQATLLHPFMARMQRFYRGPRAGRGRKGNQGTWEAQAPPIRKSRGEEVSRVINVSWPVMK